jgi:hypothetical protein
MKSQKQLGRLPGAGSNAAPAAMSRGQQYPTGSNFVRAAMSYGQQCRTGSNVARAWTLGNSETHAQHQRATKQPAEVIRPAVSVGHRI